MINETMTISQLAALHNVQDFMKNAFPEERLELIAVLMEDYCEYCGGPLYSGKWKQSCQCWNDE